MPAFKEICCYIAVVISFIMTIIMIALTVFLISAHTLYFPSYWLP